MNRTQRLGLLVVLSLPALVAIACSSSGGGADGASDGGTTAQGDGSAGTLACPAGQTGCTDDKGAGYCARTWSDPANCGTCRHACAPFEVCANGACNSTCPPGQTLCTDQGAPACVTSATNVQHCGACGLVCPTGASCRGGKCVCPLGQTACNGVCSDTSSDVVNCGRCSHDCLGGACALSACQPVELANNQDAPAQIAVDATTVYWINANPGAIKKIPISGVGGAVSISSGWFSPDALVVAPSGIYFTDRDFGKLVTIPNDGGGAQTLLTGQGSDLTGIAVDGTGVYWANTSTYQLNKLGFDGGVSTLVYEQFLLRSRPVAVGPGHVYYYDGALRSAPLDAGTQTSGALLATGAVDALAMDATYLYWTDGTSINKVPLAGGAPTLLVSGLTGGVGALAVDASGVYFVQAGNGSGIPTGTVSMVPLAGGAPVTLATKQNFPTGIAVDAARVYWTTFNGKTVMKIAK